MPTATETPIENLTEPAVAADFAAMGLSDHSLKALAAAGYDTPSPIQAGLIPVALAGRDCIGNAPTGTGKTASFLLPIIEKLDPRDPKIQALVLVPTRELAHQVGREFERLSRGSRLRAAAVVGGESMFRQIKLINGPCQLVVATPGRLMDHMGRGTVRLDAVTTVVLDEADQMLDIGFRDAIDEILESVATPRQTFLLSATMPKGVRDLTRRYLNDPADVRLIPEDEDATVKAIRQAYVMVRQEMKLDLLMGLLEREQPERALVFCRTKIGADRLGEELRSRGFKAEPMHGDLSQARRTRVLAGFRAGRVKFLVATDVVGRGIDVPGISHVVNFDIPEDPEHYVHRIGRTGRMGQDGVAHTFVQTSQVALLDAIERSIQRTLERDEVEGIPSPPRVSLPPPGRRGNARGKAPFRGGRSKAPYRGGARGGQGYGHGGDQGHGHGNHQGGGGGGPIRVGRRGQAGRVG